MENDYPFKVEIQEDTPIIFTTNWEKSIEFNFMWQEKTYKGYYWWNNIGEESIEWVNEKPNFEKKEDETMEKLIERIREKTEKENLRFKVLEL
jgi:hypothetical protein